jgi:hypothetical protein
VRVWLAGGIAWAAEADSSRAHLGPLEGLCVLRVDHRGRTSTWIGLCVKSLWTFKEGSNSDGRPDLRARFLRKSENLKGRVGMLPHPPNPKDKPAGLRRRARGLYRRRERGTEAPRPHDWRTCRS